MLGKRTIEIGPSKSLLILLGLLTNILLSLGADRNSDYRHEAANDCAIVVSGSVNVSCFGENDGEICFKVLGDSSSYFVNVVIAGDTIYKNDLSVDEVKCLTNLIAGTYEINVMDGDTCKNNFALTSPEPIVINEDKTIPTCHDSQDGVIDITVSGGIEDYAFEWQDGPDTEDYTGIGTGEYFLTITDDVGCSESFNFTLDGPDPIAAQLTIESISCFGADDGSIEVTATGGSPGDQFSFAWSNGDTLAILDSLAGDTYVVIITDNMNCSLDTMVSLVEPELLLANASVKALVPCNSESGGSAEVNPTGGTGNPTVEWSTGDASWMINNLGIGIYSVSVTDANHCVAVDSVMVDSIQNPEITEFLSEACFISGEPINLNYTADSLEAEFHWMVVEWENVNTNSSNYQGSGTGSNISETYSLLSPNSGGELTIEVYPQTNYSTFACIGETKMTIVQLLAEKDEIYIPELFTPNEDGTNDFWEVIFPVTNASENYTVQIFNRSGGMVYQNESFTENWRGEGCPDGVYYYIINHASRDEVYKGAVTILR